MPRPSVTVLAPSPLLTVTVEQGADGDAEIHLHAGGQGFWVARMAAALGARAVLCGAFGGESGLVVRALVEREGVEVRPVEASAGNGAYVHDRRDGDRREVATTPTPVLSRHEVDDLFGTALVSGLDTSLCVLAGTADTRALPADTFRRLAADLRANGATVVADLSGEQLAAALAGGIDVLKVSHDELVDGGYASSGASADVVAGIERLREAGAEHVVVTRAEERAIACLDGRLVEIEVPWLEPADTHGAGDSLTAGTAVGLARGDALVDAVRLGAAAGALNVTRRGLATGERGEIERLVRQVHAHPLPT